MYGIVWMARDLAGDLRAVKEIPKANLRDRKDEEHLKYEIACQYALQHPNLVRLYEFYDAPSSIFLVMELAHGKDLVACANSPLSIEKACEYFHQIVSGVAYMHENQLCHRDLKLDNCILDPDTDTVKICDFGLASPFKKPADGLTSPSLTTNVGSLPYMAPELFRGDYDGALVDVWALGVILYALTAKRMPFEAKDDQTMQKLIEAANPEYPPWLPTDLKDLLMKIFVADPRDRITLDGIMAHRAFNVGFKRIPGAPLRPLDSIFVIPLDDDPRKGRLLPNSIFSLIAKMGPIQMAGFVWDECPPLPTVVLSVGMPCYTVWTYLRPELEGAGKLDMGYSTWTLVADLDGEMVKYTIEFYSHGEETLLGICCTSPDDYLEPFVHFVKSKLGL